MDDPQSDAISLPNLADRKRSGRKRGAGNAMLEAYPTYHADREGPAGRACQAFGTEPLNYLFIIVFFRHRADFSNEGVGITGCRGAVWLAADIDSFGRSALPANLQVQQLGFCALDDRDIADQQTQHSLAVAS